MKLYPHQVDVLKQTKDKNRVAYYLDMGLGKTFIGSEKTIKLGADTNLIICQKSKIEDWINHFKENYPRIDIYNLTDKKRLDEFILHDTAWAGWHGCTQTIGVINYELAWRRKELLDLKNFTLMLDESSLIQNSKAKQTKFILKLQAKNIILLSGTPCSGRYENLWTQAKLLGWDIKEQLFLSHYVNFKKIDVGGVPIKIVDKQNPYKNEQRLKTKLRDYGAIFMKTEEVIDLPKQNFINVFVPSNKEYKQFIKDSYINLGKIELIGNTQLTKLLYARQLCGQYNESKLEALSDLINSTNDRLIIFYNFNDELESLIKTCETLNRPISQVNGQVKDLAAYEEQEDSITLVQYQAGSKGLNLQKANKIVYFTPTLSVENWMQSQKRIHRIGQEQPCFYYKMTCKNSVEEKIYEALERGVDYTDELFARSD